MATLTNDEFHQLVAGHIEQGNANARKSEPGVAGAALMQAAARYNVYVTSLQCVAPRIMEERRQAEIEHYIKLYREMLNQHYDEYISNFAQYRTPMVR